MDKKTKKKPCGCGSKDSVTMSVPEGMEFNKSYSMPLKHTPEYWNADRNGLVTSIKNEFGNKLDRAAKQITDLLKEKNKAYGNSALEPANIFSQANAVDSLCARIDDKLMRIKNKGIYDATEDTVLDLIGYLLLLSMALDNKKDELKSEGMGAGI